jgi:hypothetical protein
MKSPIILKNILNHFPSLTHLALDNVYFDPSLFDVFSDNKNGSFLALKHSNCFALHPISYFPSTLWKTLSGEGESPEILLEVSKNSSQHFSGAARF